MINIERVANRMDEKGFFAQLVINQFCRSDISSPAILTCHESS